MFTRWSMRHRLAMVLAVALSMSLAYMAAVVTAVVVTAVVVAAPASAHTTLTRITPARGARLTTAPTHVVLEFDAALNTTFATVVVTSASGRAVAPGKAQVLGGKVSQKLLPSLSSGSYRVSYRVISGDGHPISGESTFTLTLTPREAAPTAAATSSTSAPVPQVPVTTTPQEQATRAAPLGVAVSEGWWPRWWLPIAIAAGLIGVSAGALLWERRRR